ncbi:ferrous iron transport protein B [Dissulfurimicrobium hydrothermale]|uniref:ferrous iron transport protein B n=1 Tax=Dissulfurimicrobium hydrothermale TaxID=1750598 RepID=UPI001EDA187A|nr:ferrous iron transport protein B [Dissulfurimicrobium hydrothermale]UKL13175.1 ferrous iron transport protein B [Dissulfurimicrobium hydrothermale]
MDKKEIVIALAGNPNAGKTTLFNQLTGAHQKVGNWAGVTVEKKEGVLLHRGSKIRIVDLPGIYSLTAYSVEEVVSRNFILDEQPDVVVDVLDASNLERNLYLATQLIELNIRLVFAMNMVDVAHARGIITDYDNLARLLGVPIVKTIGTRGEGIKELLDTVLEVSADRDPISRHVHIHYGQEIEEEIEKIRQRLKGVPDIANRYYPRWTAVKLIENDPLVKKAVAASPEGEAVIKQTDISRDHLQGIFEDDPETLIAEARYGFISGALKETMRLSAVAKKTMSDHIDQVLTNRVFGFPVFILFMYLLFQGTFTIGSYPVSWIQSAVDIAAHVSERLLPDGMIKELIVNGIIGGVGGVLVFLPNIVLLFLGISLFEDTGYMARAAFIMDRVMHTLGLHGKSFIPLLMGFGCNVPAIMATRTLETRRDRILTILINPLMSCSARLPVYVLLASVFFPGREGNIIFFVYILGIVLAILMGQLFKRLLFKGEAAPFVLELPPYRLPTIKSLIIHMWDKAKVYLQKMGGVVLAFSIVIWFLGAFPRNVPYSQDYPTQKSSIEKDIAAASQSNDPSKQMQLTGQLKERLRTIERKMAKERMAHSYIGRIGKAIEPVLRPLGFDWRLGVSLLTGFVAKEVVVSTMGVLFQADDQGEDTHDLKDVLRKSGLTPATALAFMVFVLIYTPCIVTIITIWRETGSVGWTVFTVSYLLILAWIAAFLIKWSCLAMRCLASGNF